MITRLDFKRSMPKNQEKSRYSSPCLPYLHLFSAHFSYFQEANPHYILLYLFSPLSPPQATTKEYPQLNTQPPKTLPTTPTPKLINTHMSARLIFSVLDAIYLYLKQWLSSLNFAFLLLQLRPNSIG